MYVGGTSATQWLERMRTVPVLDVAQALGMTVQPPRGANGGAFACPACNAETRHTKTHDKRAAAGVRNDGHGWRCFQCDASGDAIDLVAYHLRGKKLPELHDHAKAEVRDWCASWLGLINYGPQPNARPNGSSARAHPPKPLPAQVSAPRAAHYPPAEQVNKLWKSAVAVTADAEVCEWLSARRGLDPRAIASLDLARVVPKRCEQPLPAWAGFGGDEPRKPWRPWPGAGLRLLVPLYDAQGRMRSMLFRRTFETPESWPPKSIGTTGFERAGLIMANAVGCHLLAHGAPNPASSWSHEKIAVVIEEGETDWLTGCLAWASANERAIFGVTSGSWTSAIADRLPAGARVTIRTDNDEAGDLLAGKIAKTLQGRCTVLRGGQNGTRT